MSRKEHVNPVMRRQRRKLRNQLIWGSAPVWLVVIVLAIKMITMNVIESGAQQHMERGEYAQAVEQYERLRTWNIFQPHLTYVNAGIAAMHGELWPAAVDNLTSALRHTSGELYCEVQDMRYTALREYAWDLEDDGDAAVDSLRKLQAALEARSNGDTYNEDDLDPDGDGLDDDPAFWLAEAILFYQQALDLLEKADEALQDPACSEGRTEQEEQENLEQQEDTQENADEVQEKLDELTEESEEEQVSEEEQERRDQLNENNEQAQQERERQQAEQQQQQQGGQSGDGQSGDGQSGQGGQGQEGEGEGGEGGESGEGEQPGEGGTDPGESGGSEGGEGNESGGEGGTDPGESGGSEGGEGNESGGEGGSEPGESGGEGDNQNGGGGGGPSQPTDPPDPNAGKDQNPITDRPW